MLADKMTQLMMEFVTLKPVTEDNVKAVVEAMAAVMCKPENLKAVVEMVNQK
jgi:DNA-directed RNA polymerase subunit F